MAELLLNLEGQIGCSLAPKPAQAGCVGQGAHRPYENGGGSRRPRTETAETKGDTGHILPHLGDHYVLAQSGSEMGGGGIPTFDQKTTL